jgi:hypothetical protein
VHADVVAAPEVIHSSAGTHLTPSCAQTFAVNSWFNGPVIVLWVDAAVVVKWLAVVVVSLKFGQLGVKCRGDKSVCAGDSGYRAGVVDEACSPHDSPVQ